MVVHYKLHYHHWCRNQCDYSPKKSHQGHTPEEAALLHDDNNQNHYNEDTTYEYNNDTPQNKDENYNIDQNADNEKPEDQETLKDKIVDKFKTTMTTMKNQK